jgi:hypothetical protein
VRGIKFDSVKNFLENRKGSRREKPSQVQSSGGLRFGEEEKPTNLIVMND